MSLSTSVIEDDDTPLSVMFEHCVTVWKRMEEDAQLVDVEVPTEKDGWVSDKALVWEGHLTKLICQELRFSTPYYTKLTRELKRMGCIAQKRRGGGSSESQWLVLREPTEQLFKDESTKTNNAATRKYTRLQILEQRVADVAREQTKIKADYEAILDILMEQEKPGA